MVVKLKLKHWRKDIRQMTQEELAQQMGVSKQFVSRCEIKSEKGELRNIGLDTLDRLCRALQCSPGDLFEYIPEKELTS